MMSSPGQERLGAGPVTLPGWGMGMAHLVLLLVLLAAWACSCAGTSGALRRSSAAPDPALQEAMGRLEEARRHPKEPDGWLEAARAFELLGEEQRALDTCAAGLRSVPVRSRAALLEAAAASAERSNAAERALSWLETLHAADPADAELSLRLALAKARSGGVDEARARIRALVGEGRCSPARGLLTGSWVELYAGRPELAGALASLARARGEERASQPLAIVHALAGRLDQAVAELQQALEQEPQSLQLRLLLGQVLLLGGSTKGSADELLEVVEARPRHARALLWAAMALAADGRTNEAKDLLARAIETGHAAAHLPLGLLGPPGEAGSQEHLKAYLHAFPDAPEKHPARRALAKGKGQ